MNVTPTNLMVAEFTSISGITLITVLEPIIQNNFFTMLLTIVVLTGIVGYVHLWISSKR